MYRGCLFACWYFAQAHGASAFCPSLGGSVYRGVAAHRGTLHGSHRWGGDQAPVPAGLERWPSLPVLNYNKHFALGCEVLSRINSYGNEFRGKYFLFDPFY